MRREGCLFLHWCWLYVIILVKSGAAARDDSCDNDAAPTYVSLECVILGKNVISRIYETVTHLVDAATIIRMSIATGFVRDRSFT